MIWGIPANSAATIHAKQRTSLMKILRRLQILAIAALTLLVATACGGGEEEFELPTPVHLWISNQSLGTGIASVQMTVALDDAVIIDEPMAVETQHNVATVDQTVSAGSHDIDVTVGDPYDLLTSETVEISGEVWIFVRFWFDPQSVHENQQTPTTTIDVFDKEPGIK